MKIKMSLKRSWFIVGILFSAIIIFFLAPDLPAQDSFAPSLLQASLSALPTGRQAGQAGSLLPTRLKIPNINIDATVEYVGLTPDGSMGAPKGPAEVAWFNLGPRPGEKGSAVIAGHSGYKNNKPAVFDNLYKLGKGDKIYIEDEKGVIITFVVREIRKYDSNADAANVFDSNDNQAHLNLVTCTGIWDETEKSRSERLVVFADKE